MARSRHKGAREVERTWPDWGENHPVYHSIATGTHWLDAWIGQAGTPWVALARQTGVEVGRLMSISQNDYVRQSEIVAFAVAWGVNPEQVIASLPNPALLRE